MLDMYDEYVTDVSNKGAVISALCIPVLFDVLRELPKEAKIADFGSGFSSVILRTFVKDKPGTEVYSIDTDYYWLRKTKEFLIRFGLSTENLLLWEQYEKMDKCPFDFILFDISLSKYRHIYLKSVIENNIKPETILWIDDAHKNAMIGNFKVVLNNQFEKYDLVSLKEKTLDSFGRWASYIHNFQVK